MTSYGFEVAAKNAVCEVLKKMYGIDASVKDLHIVWFAHVLGCKKASIWGRPMDRLYAEVSYNLAKDEMYVDMYYKQSNTVISGTELDYKVHDAERPQYVVSDA